MSKKLPEGIVDDLNTIGLGGRIVYVPLRKKTKTISERIYESMISDLREGKSIDLDKFQNMVSLRTLYRLKAKAIEEFERFKKSGDNYLVGERALLQTGSHYLRTVEELIEFYPLFVGIAAEKIGITNNDALVVGLPFDFWKAETSKKKQGIPNAIERLKDSLKLIRLNDAEFSFKKVLVFPQGLGGIKDYLSENRTDGNILAIDIGFNTVISTLYSCEEKEILTGKTYYKRGLHEMAVNLIMPEIASHIGGKTLTPLEINHLVQTGSVQVGFDLIDIKPEINAAVSTYMRDLLNIITGDLKAHGGVIAFDTVLFFGGGTG